MLLRTVLCLLALPLYVASGQTQSAINARAARNARRADSTLHILYQALETKYRTDSVALRKLRVAQRAWLAFRDAQVDATYPATDRAAAYGSVLPMCISELLEELAKARINQLRQALRPIEADVCAGGPG
jgi:uncharacterized protein YecT (DUF1311 family)